jgi:hypothetical protein
MARNSFKEGNEGSDGVISFTVTRTGSVLGTSSATWAIEAGSGDYVVNEADFGGFFPSGLVNFAVGERVKTVTVLTQGDNIREYDEALRVVLSAPSTGTSIIGSASMDASLQNDDVGVSITSLTGTALEGASGTETEFEFELSAEGSNRATSVRVTWHVEGVSTNPEFNPMNSADFVDAVMPYGEETFTLNSGSGSTNFSVWVAGDNVFGPNEQFKVVIDTVDAFDSLGAVLGASVMVGEAMGTTLADDTLMGLRQEAHSVVEGNSGFQEVRFYVDVLGSSSDRVDLSAIHVAYHLTGDVNASDFVGGVTSSTDATLTHDEVNDSYYIAVNVKGDTTVEATERYVLHLDSAGMDTPDGGNVEIARQASTVGGEIAGDDYGISLMTSNLSQSEDRARFVFDVLRSGPLDHSMDVTYQLGVPTLGDGQYGVSANDFSSPISASLHFEVGQTTARFVLEANHDFAIEANERFAVTATVTGVDGVSIDANALTSNEFVYVEGWLNNDDGVLPMPYEPDPQHPVLDTLHA